MATDLTITGIQALRLPHKGRNVYRIKSSTSFGDEMLFCSPSRSSHVSAPHFDSQWAENVSQERSMLWSSQTPSSFQECSSLNNPSPVRFPRKKKYRLKNRFPSYCDETLFGSKKEEPEWDPPWAKKQDTPKLHPLRWAPHSAPKLQCNRSDYLKKSPQKATPSLTPKSNFVDFQSEYHKMTDFWQQPDSDTNSLNLNQESKHSKSLNPLQKEKLPTSQPSPNQRLLVRKHTSRFSDCLTGAATASIGRSRPPWK